MRAHTRDNDDTAMAYRHEMAKTQEDPMTKTVGTGAHLSVDELRVWTSLLDTIRIIDTEAETQLLEQHDMSHREYEVLVRVDGAGGTARMSTLARQIEASPPLITQTVTRLETRGWIERKPSPDDKRGVDATLTQAGRQALATAAAPHAELIRSILLAPLGNDVSLVADLVEPIAAHLRAHRAGTDCDDETCPVA